jgi:hypothetical protein
VFEDLHGGVAGHRVEHLEPFGDLLHHQAGRAKEGGQLVEGRRWRRRIGRLDHRAHPFAAVAVRRSDHGDGAPRSPPAPTPGTPSP